jgi:protein SCO1
MSARRAPRGLSVVVGVLALAAVAVVALLIARGNGGSREAGEGTTAAVSTDSATGFAGAELPQPATAYGFELSDQSGRAVSLGALHGKVVVLAFLSSSCGRTCVLVAQQIRGALDELAAPVSALLVSVDPAADTAAHRRAFLGAVSLLGRASFLSGSRGELAAVWRAYHVQPLSAGVAAFEGSLQVLLIDRDGRERVLFGLEQLTPEALAHDIRKLQASSG